MLLSIIIPVYNTKDYLESCLQSVLAGDTEDCEILLIDDGSTDGETPALCDALAEKHAPLVRVIHQENKGLGGARNTGIENCSGEYVFFPDSDDRITPDCLSLLKKNIRETGAEIIAFDFCSDDGMGHLTPMSASQFYSDVPFTLEERPDFLLSLPSACSRVWKKSLFLDSGVRYPSKVWYEDLRTSMKLFALAGSIVSIPEKLYLYLQRPGSIMHSANVSRNHEIVDAFQDLLGWFGEHGLLEKYRMELGRLCIDHMYLAASIRVLMADTKHPLLNEFRDYLREHFPDYRSNPYLPQLTSTRRLAFRLLEGRHYHILKLLFRIRGN